MTATTATVKTAQPQLTEENRLRETLPPTPITDSAVSADERRLHLGEWLGFGMWVGCFLLVILYSAYEFCSGLFGR